MEITECNAYRFSCFIDLFGLIIVGRSLMLFEVREGGLLLDTAQVLIIVFEKGRQPGLKTPSLRESLGLTSANSRAVCSDILHKRKVSAS